MALRPSFAAHSRVAALATAIAVAPSLAGCSSPAESRGPPLPDLATQSPSKQPIMTPAEQKKAIDAIAAKRDAQAAETARQAK